MKEIKIGEKINVFEYHTGKWLTCKIIGNILEEDKNLLVPIQFPNGDKWNAIWTGKGWESEEI